MAARQSISLSSEGEAETGVRQAYCWACRALVVVPVMPDGSFAPLFKCGWCGALNPKSPASTIASGAVHTAKADEGSASLTKAHWGSSCERVVDHLEGVLYRVTTCSYGPACFRILQVGVVVIVSSLIASIGIFGTFPVIFTFLGERLLLFSLHVAIMLLLEINILVNYFQAILLSSGNVHQFYNLFQVPPAQSSFENFTWCSRCQAPKPPNAHHCRTCGMCVVDMDHHCPFIANCVGRGNIRPFLLFLLWVTFGMFYAIPMLTASLLGMRLDAMRILHRNRQRRFPSSRVFRMPLMLLSLLGTMPPVFLVNVALLITCIIVLLMVGSLCLRHWSLAMGGTTYIGSLQGERTASAGWFTNLRKIFGQNHPWTWLLPSFKHANGAAKTVKGA